MTDVISIDDAPVRRARGQIHDDLIYQIREIQLISDLMISSSEISDDTANGVGTMLYRMACNAADLAEEAWKLGGAS